MEWIRRQIVDRGNTGRGRERESVCVCVCVALSSTLQRKDKLVVARVGQVPKKNIVLEVFQVLNSLIIERAYQEALV